MVQTPQDAPVQAAGKSGYIVQLGVFQNRANAESFFSYVKQSLDGNRFKARLEMRADKKFRVYVGAYKTLKEAQNAARALSESLGLETFLTKG
ncbi:MAG: SPOR domain-containing protein, partial [Burkholderiales bacterium]|nr:SPOR domain-containing protein [Burkholderiales bacterium]